MFAGRLQVTLFVQDVQGSVDYYQRVLGFAFKGYWSPEHQRVVEVWTGEQGPQYAEVVAGENIVGLRPAAQPDTVGAELALRVDDLDLLHRRVKDNGAAATEPRVQPWGARSFRLTDPDGHVWVLIQAQGY